MYREEGVKTLAGMLRLELVGRRLRTGAWRKFMEVVKEDMELVGDDLLWERSTENKKSVILCDCPAP